MNIWTKKSFKLHNSYGYLDKLNEIYPMLDNSERELDMFIKEDIKEAYTTKNDAKLFSLLLPLKKFPLKDSYKAYFSRTPKNEQINIIKNNPATISRICNRLYEMGWDKLVSGLEEPIETNRQIGPMFPKWIRNQYPCYDNFDKFKNSSETISVLSASDDGLVKFVENYLNVQLPKTTSNNAKGLDLVVKINTKVKPIYVIGEAKFLTDEGGHQNAQLKDALHLITANDFNNNNSTIDVLRIAVLDGVCWINSKDAKMQKEIKGLNENQIAISALLLNDFFLSLIK
ncbi:restriction endonuclease [Clostridium saudiense]|uniref:restriction endonuclease n=1 Tax=Clostridium saudiense TaxID=1414720 RepID=UPI0018A9DA64|nr:restriction endonuclease [Clostridium saudiense]